MIIPIENLSSEAIEGLAQQYAFAVESSDYDETPLETRVERIIQLLKQGELVVVFSELHEEASIRDKRELGMG